MCLEFLLELERQIRKHTVNYVVIKLRPRLIYIAVSSYY